MGSKIDALPRKYFLGNAFFLCFFLGLIHCSFARKLSDYYVSRPQKGHVLYLIEPNIKYINKKEKTTFVYDVTYLTSSDSVRINFYYTSRDLRNIERVVFKNNDIHAGAVPQKFYVDRNKKYWVHRYSIVLALKDFRLALRALQKPEILIIDKSKKIDTVFLNGRLASKQQDIIDQIFTIIEAN